LTSFDPKKMLNKAYGRDRPPKGRMSLLSGQSP